MKCSCELRFWVRKAISHLSTQQLSRKSGSRLPLAVPVPPHCPPPPPRSEEAQAGINIGSFKGRWLGVRAGHPMGLRGGDWEQLAWVPWESGRLFFLSF